MEVDADFKQQGASFSGFTLSTDFFVAPYLDGSQSGSIKLAMGYNLPLVGLLYQSMMGFDKVITGMVSTESSWSGIIDTVTGTVE